MADYVFYRIFDVKSCTISDQMDDTVGGLKVKFVFNRAESVGTLDVPTLVSNSKDEARNVIAWEETPKLLGNNSTQQLNNLKWHENGNPVLEKEGTDLKQVQVNLESLLGDYSAGVDVNANKDRETTGTILGAENVGCGVSTEKDKVKDKKTLINQVQVEKRMSSARSPCDLDDTPLKRVKFDGPSSSSKGRERPSTGNVVSHNETARLSTTNVPHEAPKSGSNKDHEGSGQSAKLVKSASASFKRPLDTSTRLSKEKSNTRHDACHENKDAILDNDSCSMEGGLSKKGKYDDSLKISKDNNNNSSVKFKEKTSLGETKNSPKLAISHDKKEKSRLGEGSSNENHNDKVGKLSNDNLPNLLITTTDGGGKNVEGRIFEVTRRPIAEKGNWMKLPWEEKMKTAHDQGRLVLLQNLDPEYTSGEVQDIISSAFDENCTARMVQHTATSSPHSGQAFVIFKSREAVDRVVKKLDDECLMLPNQRPLVVCTGVFPHFSEKRTTFVGHLAIDKARRQVQREMKEAVSTSHYSQNNTIEYEMAMAWCLLQSKSDKWWEKLYEQQGKELKKLVGALKSK
ncbi:protein ANTI-SILENCING 1 isoform X2 [Sesamum indicum]|nr:protein ANTI-SILENCING 1 isoform X2 [Sesamum indicum]